MEILVDLDNLDIFNILDHKYLVSNNISIISNIIAYQKINMNIFNKVFMLCVRNKLFRMIKKNKNMTSIISKLKEMHAD